LVVLLHVVVVTPPTLPNTSSNIIAESGELAARVPAEIFLARKGKRAQTNLSTPRFPHYRRPPTRSAAIAVDAAGSRRVVARVPAPRLSTDVLADLGRVGTF